MNNDKPSQAKRLDRTAFLARSALAAGLALLSACIIYGSMTDQGWLTWLLARGWLVTFIIVIIVLTGTFIFALTLPKNIAWRSLQGPFGMEFGEILDRKNFGTGRGQVGDHAYFGLRCFGSPSGLEVSRIVSFVNPPLYIPWSAMAKIDTFPNLLTGRKDFETDMQAQIVLRDQSELTIELPWLTEYRQLLPKSVKYRAIKLSKK
ncbi:MAG: hypothetical protein QGH93_03190 [Gammaproteobacteria bacterium]|jgi:hypothetical protein|nr:hypothetical protein [Chromatiales bacterium]MDP6673844.1 hypothetical protein [Gammaproteobacteria bacterium]